MFTSQRIEQLLWWFLPLFLLIGFFLNLGVQPLYLEEPRRAFIAMEMLQNENWVVPTLWGEYYYYKPPLFNWLLLLSTRMFGGFSEWALRLPTVLSTLAIAWMMYRTGSRQIGERFGRYSAYLFLVSIGILYYFSIIAEIDLFFSLLIFGAILCIYHFYEKEKHWMLFISVYTLCGLAFLCKGLPSLVFAGFSLLGFFIWKKRFRLLFHPAHFVGLGIATLLIGGYFFWYSRYNHPGDFLRIIWLQSSERAAWSKTVSEFLLHLLIFPLDFLKDLIPAALLLPVVFRKDFGKQLRSSPFVFFCLLMLLANIVVYWLSPGTRMRYVYMLFPFAIFILVWFWQRPDAKPWVYKTVGVLLAIPTVALPLGMIALPFIPDFQFLSYRYVLAVVGFLLFAGLAYLHFRLPNLKMLTLLVALSIGRIIFDLTVLPQRAHDSGGQRNHAMAEAIHQIVGDHPLYIVGPDKIFSYTGTFYLDRLRKQYIRRKDELEAGNYYLISVEDMPASAKVLMEYEYEDEEQALILVE